MKRLILSLRALVFYAGYILLTVWFGFSGMIFFSWQPYNIRRTYILLWNRCTIGWLRLICGVRYKVIGMDNIPPGTFVVLSKHNSQWETFYLQLLFQPLTTIMKRELLNIPAFGWGLRLIKPIAIDRGNPRDAMRQMLVLGTARIKEGISVLVFPEGTRSPRTGDKPKYARGGAALGIRAGVPLVPVAHNAGDHWPPHQLIKNPGLITVSIGQPLESSNGNAHELTEQAQGWIELESKRLKNKGLR
jgi:1-acyl-sn-glycerol-3-phosphate acyltransferase